MSAFPELFLFILLILQFFGLIAIYLLVYLAVRTIFSSYKEGFSQDV